MGSEPGMETKDLIELLNGDLETEFQSIVQYVRHVATISGPEYMSTVDELKIHLGQELQHATTLAEQVSFLGGEPSTALPAVADTADSRGALEADLDLETHQLERYRERVQQATDLGWPTSRKRSGRSSPRPRSTCAISAPRSAGEPPDGGAHARVIASSPATAATPSTNGRRFRPRTRGRTAMLSASPMP